MSTLVGGNSKLSPAVFVLAGLPEAEHGCSSLPKIGAELILRSEASLSSFPCLLKLSTYFPVAVVAQTLSSGSLNLLIWWVFN